MPVTGASGPGGRSLDMRCRDPEAVPAGPIITQSWVRRRSAMLTASQIPIAVSAMVKASAAILASMRMAEIVGLLAGAAHSATGRAARGAACSGCTTPLPRWATGDGVVRGPELEHPVLLVRGYGPLGFHGRGDHSEAAIF